MYGSVMFGISMESLQSITTVSLLFLDLREKLVSFSRIMPTLIKKSIHNFFFLSFFSFCACSNGLRVLIQGYAAIVFNVQEFLLIFFSESTRKILFATAKSLQKCIFASNGVVYNFAAKA